MISLFNSRYGKIAIESVPLWLCRKGDTLWEWGWILSAEIAGRGKLFIENHVV